MYTYKNKSQGDRSGVLVVWSEEEEATAHYLCGSWASLDTQPIITEK